VTLTRKTILGAAVALAFSAGAQADIISFNPTGNGNGAGLLNNVALFDWAPGSALAVGAVPLSQVGQQFTLLYQANLTAVQDANTLNLFSNGGSGNFFTVVAGFREQVLSINGSTATFGLVAGAPNFFSICAQGALGNNLAGTGFACANPILSGNVTAVASSNYTISNFTPTNLDNSPNGNDWGAQQTVTGSGATDIEVTITGVNTNYFPSFDLVQQLVFSFWNSSQVTPFNQVDPSICLSNNGTTDCNQAAQGTLGAVNGLNGPNFIFQADANQSFVVQGVPEPASVALIGAALGIAGFVGRRRKG
jgi:hypothetical protein